MDIVKAKKAADEAYKALKKTPEYKDYKEKTKAADEALDAWNKALDAWNKAHDAEEDAVDAKDEAWDAVKATPEYKDWEKAKETMEALKETPGYKARRCFNGHNDIKK